MKKPALGPKGITAIFALIGVFCIVSGSVGLLKPAQPLNAVFSEWENGNRYAGTPALGSNCYSHIVDAVLILPVGNEYFYVLYSDNLGSALCVRSLKKLDSLEDLGTVDGVLKKLDREDAYDFRSLKSQIGESSLYFVPDYYLDTGARQLYIERILLGICILVIIVGLVYFIRLRKNSWGEYTNGERVINILGCMVSLAALWLLLRAFML